MDLANSKSKQVKVDPEEILQKVDLLRITDWDLAEQGEAHNLICECACIFSQNDLDLGKTSIVKHSIKLTDSTPFKDEQGEAYNLICECACIFSQNDLDLGKTSIVKHSIKLTDSTSFKEHY